MEGVVAFEHELGTTFDHGIRATSDQLLRPDPPTHPVTCLDHGHVMTEAHQAVGAGKTGEAGADDDDAHIGMLGRSGCVQRRVAQTEWVRHSWERAAIGALLAGALLIAGCSSGSGAQFEGALPSADVEDALTLVPAVDHVHGAVLHDGALLLGTHSGLVQVDLSTGETKRRGMAQDDLMGLASNGTDLLASGHPGPGTDLPDPLGLMRSSDAGGTWQAVSLTGEVDFHGLASTGSMVAGIGTADGVLISQDAGATWRATGVSDALGLAWFQGALWIATESGLVTWRDGVIDDGASTGQPVVALAADAGGSSLWAVATDGTVWRTDDGMNWAKRGAVTELQALAATSDTAYAVTAKRIVQIG